MAWQREAARARHAPNLLRGGHPLGELMARVYAGITQVTGAMLIIDSSKLPSGAALLASRTDVTAYLLHVVRDPRAVAYSWQRPTAQPDRPKPALIEPHGLVDSTAKWVSWNALTELTARSFPGRHLRGALRGLRRGSPLHDRGDPRLRLRADAAGAVPGRADGGARHQPHGLGQSEPVPDGDGGNPRRRRLASRAAEARSAADDGDGLAADGPLRRPAVASANPRRP